MKSEEDGDPEIDPLIDEEPEVDPFEPVAAADEAEPKARRTPRWVFVLLIILLVITAGAIPAWKLGAYHRVKAWYQRGSVIISVKDADQQPLAGATVLLAGNAYTTDKDGQASITGVEAGTYALGITATGFQPLSPTITLHRRTNPLEIYALTKQAAKLYSIKGFVQDYVSGKPLVNVQVALGSQNVLTDPNGAYSFSQIAPGDQKLAVSKAGYQTQNLTVTVSAADVVTAKVPLVPTGQTVFISNRDGRREVYAAGLDGSNQHALITPPAGEDFASSVSPDSTKIAFSSSRDGVVSNSGAALAKLYVMASDGSGLKKVSDAVAATFTPQWSPDSKHFFYSGFTDASLAQSVYAVYSLKDGSQMILGEAAGNLIFSPDSSTVAYTVLTTQTAADGTTSYAYVLKTLNLNSGQRATLATRTTSVSNLRFAADGKSVSYDVTISNAVHRFSDVIAGGAESEVATVSTASRTYVASPDGQHLAFIDVRDGQTDLFVVDKNEQGEQRLTTIGAVDGLVLPHWDTSGQYLTFAVRRTGENAIYVTALAGGDAKKISDYYLDH